MNRQEAGGRKGVGGEGSQHHEGKASWVMEGVRALGGFHDLVVKRTAGWTRGREAQDQIGLRCRLTSTRQRSYPTLPQGINTFEMVPFIVVRNHFIVKNRHTLKRAQILQMMVGGRIMERFHLAASDTLQQAGKKSRS